MTLSPFPTRGVVTAADLTALYADVDVFPYLPGREFVASKAPKWSTGVKTAATGRTIKVGYYSAPTYNFKLKHEFLRNLASKPEVATLLGFFNGRKGRYGFFFYLDAEDYQATDQAFAQGDGVTKTFQMVRTYGGSIEPVQAFWNTPVIKIAGVTTAAFTISPWGVITFTAAPASGAALTWTGSFLWVCGFDDDQLDIGQIVKELWSQDGLPFSSLKP
jgi:uncharacterized protein (TIGR02217 family)